MENIVHDKRKVYYSMGEVAEMFDVNPSLIRFWEKKFDILKPHKNKKGNRLFTPQDVDNLKLIYHLVKERGMTLAGAQKRLKEDLKGTVRDLEIADRLLAIRAMLVEIREELKKEGQIFTDDADSDEEYVGEPQMEANVSDISASGFAASVKGASSSGEKSDDIISEDDFIMLSDDVRTEVVTDGSSPWDEVSEMEIADAGAEFVSRGGADNVSETPAGDDAGAETLDSDDEGEESFDESERESAMEELRNVRDILADWNTIPSVNDGNGSSETESNTVSGEDLSEDDADNMDDDYVDPWEEMKEELSDDMESGSDDAVSDKSADNGQNARPGDLFGTDSCTTFSPDDAESIENGEAEEVQRPRIYEQTLF